MLNVDVENSVKEMILNSQMEIDNMDWNVVAKYVAVMVPQDVIEQEELVNVVPKRKQNRTRHDT